MLLILLGSHHMCACNAVFGSGIWMLGVWYDELSLLELPPCFIVEGKRKFWPVSRLCLCFFLACASVFVSLVSPVLVNWDMFQCSLENFHCFFFSCVSVFMFVRCVCVARFVLFLLRALFGAFYDRMYVVHGLVETGRVGVVWRCFSVCVWRAWVV